MHDYLVNECMREGILTTTSPRKYPLRNINIAAVCKAYALTKHMPYTMPTHKYEVFDEYILYLTDDGLEWLYSVFKQYTLPFLRSAFQVFFSLATEYDVAHPEQYPWLNNFRGTTGVKPRAGTVQRAVLIRRVGRTKRQTDYDSIAEARDDVFELLKHYPAEQFTLYRIRKQTKKGKVYYYREEIPLILPESRRGVHIRKENV